MPRALLFALAVLFAAAACAKPHVLSPVPPTRLADPATTECPPGRGDCDLDAANGCEVDLSNDADNCHVCGHSCQGGHATAGCFDGVCHLLGCEPGYGDCDHIADNGCEARLCYTSHGWTCKSEECGSCTY